MPDLEPHPSLLQRQGLASHRDWGHYRRVSCKNVPFRVVIQPLNMPTLNSCNCTLFPFPMTMLSRLRRREVICDRVCEHVVSVNMSRACSKQHLRRWDWPIKKERAQNEYTLKGWRTPPHFFSQSLHFWGFLFPCAMTGKVVLLVSMKANYFPYRLSTLEWMCVSKCEQSLHPSGGAVQEVVFTVELERWRKWDWQSGLILLRRTFLGFIWFWCAVLVASVTAALASPRRPQPLPQRGYGVSHTVRPQGNPYFSDQIISIYPQISVSPPQTKSDHHSLLIDKISLFWPLCSLNRHQSVLKSFLFVFFKAGNLAVTLQ